MKGKCSDCGKSENINNLLQVKDKYPDMPKYKLVCEECFDKKADYKFTGRLN